MAELTARRAWEPVSGAPRVGVLTFHRCINYGSYWQARCLVKGLRGMGYEAVLLDHRSTRVDRAEWRCALQPLLPAPSPPEDRPLYAAKARRFFEAFEALPMSAPFALEEPDEAPEVDLAVVGSDEVWNFRHPWYAGCSLFFGDHLKADRLVSYAASFGNHDAGDGIDGYWAERLRRFDSIAVRDHNSSQLIEAALGQAPALVLDPCLQFQDICRRAQSKPAEELVVYGHNFPTWLAAAAREWAQSRGVRIVSLGYRNDWADEQRLDASPEAFAQGIANARAVVSNFFHGCVFAMVNGKPFVCTPNDYRAHKLIALVRKLGAQSRLVLEDTPAEQVDAALDTPLEQAVHDNIAAARRRSAEYLRHALA